MHSRTAVKQHPIQIMIRKRIYRDGMVMSGCGRSNNYANRSNRSGVMMPQSWLAYLVRYRLGIAAVMGCFCACSIAMNAFLFWRVQLNYQVPVLTDGSGVRGSDGAAGIVSSLWYMHQLGQNHPHSNNDHRPYTSRHGVDGDKNSKLDPYMQALQTELELLNEQRQLHDQQQQQNTAEHQLNVQGAGAIAVQQQQQQQLPPPRPLGHLPHGAVKADHSHMVEPVDEVEKLVIQNRIHEFGEQVISPDGHGAQPQEPEIPQQGADPDITDAGRFQVPPLKQQLLNPPVKKQQQPLQQMNGIVKKGQQQQQQQQQQQRVVKKKVKKNMMNVKKQPPPPQMQQQQQQHIKSNGRQQVQQQQRMLEHPDPVVGVDKKQQQHANIHPNLVHPHVQQQQQQQGKNLHGEEHREHDQQQQQQQQQQLQQHQAVLSDPLRTAHQLANNHPPEQQHGQQHQQQYAIVHPDDTKLDLQHQQQQQQQHRPLLDPAVVVVKAGGGGGAISVKKANNNNNSNRNGRNVVKKQPMNMVLAKPPDHVGGAVADLRRHI